MMDASRRTARRHRHRRRRRKSGRRRWHRRQRGGAFAPEVDDQRRDGNEDLVVVEQRWRCGEDVRQRIVGPARRKDERARLRRAPQAAAHRTRRRSAVAASARRRSAALATVPHDGAQHGDDERRENDRRANGDRQHDAALVGDEAPVDEHVADAVPAAAAVVVAVVFRSGDLAFVRFLENGTVVVVVVARVQLFFCRQFRNV